jgi:hypothetical protein
MNATARLCTIIPYMIFKSLILQRLSVTNGIYRTQHSITIQSCVIRSLIQSGPLKSGATRLIKTLIAVLLLAVTPDDTDPGSIA